MKLGFWFGISLGALGFFGCSNPGTELQKKTEAKATEIQKELEKVRQATETLTQDINQLYAQWSTLDLNPETLDKTRGGAFEVYTQGSFYHKTDRQGASYYASPWNPAEKDRAQELKFLTLLEGPLARAYSQSPMVRSVFYGVSYPKGALAALYPWIDMISLFPPELQIEGLEWYQRGIKAQGKAQWSPNAFTDLTNRWQYDVVAGTQWNQVPRGVTALTIPLENLVSKFFGDSKESWVLLGADLTVLGQSPRARQQINFFEIPVATEAQQTRQNRLPDHAYRLTSSTQEPDFQALGQRILSGTPVFSMSLKGKTFWVALVKIPEVQGFLAGFEAP